MSKPNNNNNNNKADKYRQMYDQQQMIEERRKAISAKIEVKRRREAEEKLIKTHFETLKAELDAKGEDVTKKANLFENDGSFLEQFKKLSNAAASANTTKKTFVLPSVAPPPPPPPPPPPIPEKEVKDEQPPDMSREDSSSISKNIPALMDQPISKPENFSRAQTKSPRPTQQFAPPPREQFRMPGNQFNNRPFPPGGPPPNFSPNGPPPPNFPPGGPPPNFPGGNSSQNFQQSNPQNFPPGGPPPNFSPNGPPNFPQGNVSSTFPPGCPPSFPPNGPPPPNFTPGGPPPNFQGGPPPNFSPGGPPPPNFSQGGPGFPPSHHNGPPGCGPPPSGGPQVGGPMHPGGPPLPGGPPRPGGPHPGGLMHPGGPPHPGNGPPHPGGPQLPGGLPHPGGPAFPPVPLPPGQPFPGPFPPNFMPPNFMPGPFPPFQPPLPPFSPNTPQPQPQNIAPPPPPPPVPSPLGHSPSPVPAPSPQMLPAPVPAPVPPPASGFPGPVMPPPKTHNSLNLTSDCRNDSSPDWQHNKIAREDTRAKDEFNPATEPGSENREKFLQDEYDSSPPNWLKPKDQDDYGNDYKDDDHYKDDEDHYQDDYKDEGQYKDDEDHYKDDFKDVDDDHYKDDEDQYKDNYRDDDHYKDDYDDEDHYKDVYKDKGKYKDDYKEEDDYDDDREPDKKQRKTSYDPYDEPYTRSPRNVKKESFSDDDSDEISHKDSRKKAFEVDRQIKEEPNDDSQTGNDCKQVMPVKNEPIPPIKLEQEVKMETECKMEDQHKTDRKIRSKDVKTEVKTEPGSSSRGTKRRSRWGDPAPEVKPPGVVSPALLATASKCTPTIKITGMSGCLLSKVNKRDKGLLQYAMSAYGSNDLSEEDWKKAEDNYKIHLLYQDMMQKRAEVERLQSQGKHKYEYDSDEEVEGGTWEHRAREKEMIATKEWASKLTEMAHGKHHIGDFLPPEELKKFMDRYTAVKGGGAEPDLSDYKEFKLTEENKGFQMLQKLGWSEGQGLGADGSGIVDPVNKTRNRDANMGLGAERPDDVASGDDEYEAYRKRMMLAYRFRPNPLNNPRRPYY